MTLTTLHATTSPWQREDVVAYLVKEWRSGQSATQIVAKLRASFGIVTTRNSVIGALHRRGESSRSPGRAVETTILQNKLRARPRKEAVVRISPPKSKPPIVRVALPDIPSPLARPWQHRRHGQCTWPILADGVTLSCCSPIARGSFCSGHAQVGYDTVRKLDVDRAAKHMARFDGVET